MAAVLTGTPTAINWGTSATPAAQDITIPSDATAVYVFASGYRESGANIPTFTLADAAPAQHFDMSGDPGSLKSGSVAVWYLPSTGTQALAITWPTAQDFNPACIVAYVKGGDTTAWRDADADNGEDVAAVSVTLTTAAGDLVIKYDCVAGDPPALTSGWTSAQTQDVGGDGARLSTISAAGATQVCDCEGEFYSIVLAVAIPAAAATASLLPMGGSRDLLTGRLPHLRMSEHLARERRLREGRDATEVVRASKRAQQNGRAFSFLSA
jgi:hypothetical protein